MAKTPATTKAAASTPTLPAALKALVTADVAAAVVEDGARAVVEAAVLGFTVVWTMLVDAAEVVVFQPRVVV